MTIEEIKDKVARNQYGIDYFLLTDSQKVSLTDLIAAEYAIEEINQFSKNILNIINPISA